MRKEKQLLLNEIKDKIDSSKAMLVASYNALEPNTSWAFREQLTKLGSQFEVVRKRVFLKAAEQSGVKLDSELLNGHVGVVFVSEDDHMPTTKAVFKFSEERAKILQVLCGQIDGKFVPGSELEMLSKLPGIDEMRAQLIGLFIAPMAQLLSVMEAAIEGPLSNAEEKSQKIENEVIS